MDQLQALVLRTLCTKSGWHAYGAAVEDVFNDNTALALYEHIKALHHQSSLDISLNTLRLDIQATYRSGETRADELLEVVNGLGDIDSTAQSVIPKFIAREKAIKAAQYIATHANKDDFNLNTPLDMLQGALDVSQGAGEAVMGISEYGLPGETNERADVCTLGFSPELDIHLGGGIARGELTVLLAPPARGKTSYLCASGARQALAGCKVLHVTLEIPGRRVARRYESTLTGLTVTEMIDRPNAVLAARAQVDKAGGAICIADRSYTSVAPNDIKALVYQARSDGVDISTVIVDYLELMVPNQSKYMSRREQRHVYGQLGKDIRAMAVELDVRVLTAWQVNREGSNLDVIRLDHVSECWDIIKHADTILALNQSDKERENNVMRMSVLKQRNNTARPWVDLHSDLNRNQIRPLKDRDRRIQTDITIGGKECQ